MLGVDGRVSAVVDAVEIDLCSGVGSRVLPGAVIGGEDNNGVGRLSADDVPDPAGVVRDSINEQR
jgi:hypothetical protein